MSGIDLAGRASSQEREKRSQPFTATAYGIGHIAFDRGIESCRLLRDAPFHFVEMRLNEQRHSSQRPQRRSG